MGCERCGGLYAARARSERQRRRPSGSYDHAQFRGRPLALPAHQRSRVPAPLGTRGASSWVMKLGHEAGPYAVSVSSGSRGARRQARLAEAAVSSLETSTVELEGAGYSAGFQTQMPPATAHPAITDLHAGRISAESELLCCNDVTVRMVCQHLVTQLRRAAVCFRSWAIILVRQYGADCILKAISVRRWIKDASYRSSTTLALCAAREQFNPVCACFN